MTWGRRGRFLHRKRSRLATGRCLQGALSSPSVRWGEANPFDNDVLGPGSAVPLALDELPRVSDVLWVIRVGNQDLDGHARDPVRRKRLLWGSLWSGSRP